MNLKDTDLVWSNLHEKFAPHCDRCEVAGSIRCREEYPGDVDIVLIAANRRPALNFGQKEPPHINMLERTLWTLEQARKIEKLTGGPKYKRYTLDASNWGISSAIPVPVKVQLTIATVDNWAYWYLIRTGPANFSRWIVTPQSESGAIPEGMYYSNFHLWEMVATEPIMDVVQGREPRIIDTPEESDWFEALDLPYIEPKDRRVPRK